jgi:hypothetical protein
MDMNRCPLRIDDSTVLAWATVGAEATPTGATVHNVNGTPLGPVPALAICQYDENEGFYLFYCNEDWQPLTDTWHETLDAAKAQAEFEYVGISSRWHPP